jgi:uncharacterized protein (DUF2141 family)
MKKIILILSFFAGISMFVFSQDNTSITVTLEIHNVTPGKGKLYGGVYFTERAYKDRIFDIPLEYETTGTIIVKHITLPAGEYVINFYQDLDNNGECKSGFFGIPKEPVGIVNWDGSGPPGGFRDLKMYIDGSTNKVVIELYNM